MARLGFFLDDLCFLEFRPQRKQTKPCEIFPGRPLHAPRRDSESVNDPFKTFFDAELLIDNYRRDGLLWNYDVFQIFIFGHDRSRWLFLLNLCNHNSIILPCQ